MFCCIFDYSPKAMKLTKQINKKINQNHWLKIVKTHHLNNENLGIQNFHWIFAVGAKAVFSNLPVLSRPC